MLIRQRRFGIWYSLAVAFGLLFQSHALAMTRTPGDSLSFSLPVKYHVGNRPHGICAADLNDDGAPDIVAANSQDAPTGDISVLLNAGYGTFLPESRYPTGGSNPHKVVAANLNGDSYPDIAVADPYANKVSVFVNSGLGTPVLDANYSVSHAVSLECGDFSGDGAIDLAIARFFGTRKVSILRNLGDGEMHLEDSSYTTGTSPCALAADDFNGDGRLDLAVTNAFLPGSSNTVTVLTNDGGFFEIDSNYAVVERPTSIAAVDLNRDNYADLVVTNEGTNVVSVLMNNQFGEFNIDSTYSVGNAPEDIVAADLDNDGAPDLVVANFGASYISILKNLGDGTFAPSTNYGSIGSPRSLAVSDFDQDGDIDIAVTENGTDSVVVFSNQYAEDCAANNCGLDLTPNSIVYNCSGDFTFDVNIGNGVTALDAANVWLTYPAELSVSSVIALDANFFLAYTQSTNILNTRDTLKANLGVLSGSTNGPDGLFAVTMNGSVSCMGGDIEMIYLDLRDSTNSPIVVPMATPIDFQSNCADPTIVVNSPATGGFYNTNPVLSLTAGDDCDLDAVYYQIDGCTPGGWLPIATGLSGTAYNNAAWSMTPAQFTALTEAAHCIRFKVTDDFGRANSDSCTYTWCFTKDITAPAAPTALVAQPGHNKIQLTWTNSSSADVVGVKIQRVPWTNYPDYGSVPTLTPAPAYPANHGVGTTVHTAAATPSSSASHLDVMGLTNATRDIYYFGAFAYDAAGNYSVAAAPAQARATSYWLGDLANEAVVLGNFDGLIYFGDLVHFASTYGLNQGDLGYVNHADFGPTHNNSPKGIPLPDDKVEFEDLAIFAINFNKVAPMAAKNSPTLTGAPIEQTAGLKLVDRLANDGYYVDLYLSNRSNDAKSLIGEISFDPTQLTFVSSTIGADLANPSLPIFYKPLVGENKVSISAAVLGQGSAFTGSGVIATLKFWKRSATAPRARLTRADIRDNENNSIIEQIQIVEQPEPISEVALPTSYIVGQNSPNPFNPETSISYGLPTATKLSIRIYNVMGQLVRTLVDEYQAAGTHEVIWNGTTDSGSKVASGIYFYRFETADFQKTVKMTILK